MTDVGAALTGKYADFRRSSDVEDRRDEPWPYWEGVPEHPQIGAPSMDTVMEILHAILPPKIPPVTPLAIDAGVENIGKPEPYKEYHETLKRIENGPG